MDDIVKQAIAKWPNVPHCYGWLALDARGAWRMRDERSQALNLAGEKIANQALLGFINRNYAQDERGCWYFQNGPQRVYVTLEATPYIAHTDAGAGFVLHTAEAVEKIDAAWLTETGQLVLQSEKKIALVDDRDTAQCITRLYVDGKRAGDEELLAWLEDRPDSGTLTLQHADLMLPVHRIMRAALPAQFGFVQMPQP